MQRKEIGMDEQIREKVFGLFTHVAVCKSFSRAEIQEKIFKKGLAKIIEYSRGETIISEGKYDNWVYWLIEGKINVVKNGVTVATFERVGDMFGEMGILDGDARSASVVAAADTICLTIDMSILDHPGLQQKISREDFCRDIAQATKGRLVKTTCRLTEAEQRLLAARQQLEATEQKLRETMSELNRTRELISSKDEALAALHKQLEGAHQELALVKQEQQKILSFIEKQTGLTYMQHMKGENDH